MTKIAVWSFDKQAILILAVIPKISQHVLVAPGTFYLTGIRIEVARLPDQVQRDVVVEQVQRTGQGFNALSGAYENLLEAGILDAAKVVRLGLQDAVSIASLLITTEVVVADKPEPPAAPAPGGDPMGGMGGLGGVGGMGMPGMM